MLTRRTLAMVAIAALVASTRAWAADPHTTWVGGKPPAVMRDRSGTSVSVNDRLAKPLALAESYRCGDANGDGSVNVQDVFYLINFLFAGGPDPIGPGDVNADGAVNVQDVFYLINYLFAGGPAPVETEVTVYLGPGNTVPLVLVKIPAGTFTMGSPDAEPGHQSNEGPQHEVTITQAYYLGKSEVTQGQWTAVMGTPMPSGCGSYGIGDDNPTYCVSWDEICGGTTGSDCAATSFIGRVNALLGTTAFRLPTEAEWERAARGGTTTPFSFPTPATWDMACGSFPEAGPYMWWCYNSGYVTRPVSEKQANPYDLHDIHGNVWEWVADWYDSYTSAPQTDPAGPSSGSYRVARGGGFDTYAQYCRLAYRDYYLPDGGYGGVGFRLARSLASTLAPGWPVFLGTPANGQSYTPTLFDIDGNSAAEIFVHGGGDTFALRGNGSFLPGWPTSEQYLSMGTQGQLPGPSVGDLDGDGIADVLWAFHDWSYGSFHTYAFNARRLDGSNVSGFPPSRRSCRR